jgi:hypothetical protein
VTVLEGCGDVEVDGFGKGEVTDEGCVVIVPAGT